ncbi:myb-like protein X [Branchiostoma lanceolatum]|uniref:myb-like protein X n=1 Tax=Branchiostoma lanceolatum TaxID=7740 RepID=UPI003455D35C
MATEKTDVGSSKRRDISTSKLKKPKKAKFHLKRVFKRKRNGQGEKMSFKAVTPSSDPCSNWSPGATTCPDVHESTSGTKVPDCESTSIKEPTRENLRKLKQEPFKEREKERQEAETNSIETTGVEIIEEHHDTASNGSANPPPCVDAKEEPVDVNDSPVSTLDMKRERQKKKRKWFVVRSSKKRKKNKFHLKRVFKGKKKGQGEKMSFKAVTPSSDPCSNWSPGATTCPDVHELTSGAKVPDCESTSIKEPTRENLRKQKQEPLTEEEKQRQQAETNPIETTGVEIIEELCDAISNGNTNPQTCVDTKEEPVKVNDSPVATLDMKQERHKKKRKWFVVRFSKKTTETNNSDAGMETSSEKAQIETMSDEDKRKELLEKDTSVANLESTTEKKKRGLKTPWKKAKRKREEKDMYSSSESDQTEEKLSDVQDDRTRHKKRKRKWPRMLKKKPKTSDSVPEVVVNNEQPKQQTLEDLQREVKETQKIVRDIVENKLAERDEKLRDLTRVAEDLEKAAEQFEKVSRKVRVKMWMRSRKWTLCTMSTVVILLSVGAIVLCVIFV